MAIQTETTSPDTAPPRTTGRHLMSAILRGILALAIIAGGILIAMYLKKTAPQSRPRPVTQVATLVEYRTPQRQSVTTTVHAMGTVVPARQVVIQPQVSGPVVSVHDNLTAGGTVQAGEILVQIDPQEYQIAVRREQATLARAQATLALAQWELARMRRLEQRNAANDKELQDAKAAHDIAAADVESARAALNRAELDLARTNIHAPFSGIILDEQVEPGAQLTPTSQIATLAGTDTYWVRTLIPVDKLPWIDIPIDPNDTGSSATIRQNSLIDDADDTAPTTATTTRTGLSDTAWHGTIVRLQGDLEPQGRMARILIAVVDPLNQHENYPLLLGAYVQVTIRGRTLHNVFVLDRSHVHANDSVHLFGDDNTLKIVRPHIVYRSRDHIYIDRGLDNTARIITTPLSAPVEGMPLRDNDNPPPADSTTPTTQSSAPAHAPATQTPQSPGGQS